MNDRLHFFAPTQSQPWRRSASMCTCGAMEDETRVCPCPNECRLPEPDEKRLPITGARPLVLYLLGALSALVGLIARFWNRSST